MSERYDGIGCERCGGCFCHCPPEETDAELSDDELTEDGEPLVNLED